jgi:hypothetical protein
VIEADAELDAVMVLDVASDWVAESVSEAGTDKVAAPDEVWLTKEDADSEAAELDIDDPQ